MSPSGGGADSAPPSYLRCLNRYENAVKTKVLDLILNYIFLLLHFFDKMSRFGSRGKKSRKTLIFL